MALMAALVAVAVGVLLARLWTEHRQRQPVAAPGVVVPPPVAVPAPSAAALLDSLRAGAGRSLAEVGLWPDLLGWTQRPGDLDVLTVRVPADLPLTLANHVLTRLVRTAGGEVIHAEETIPQERVELDAAFDSVVVARLVLERAADLQRRAGRIALIVAGVGRRRLGAPHVAAWCALPSAVAFCMWSGAAAPDSFVQAAAAAGHQLFVELPVKPLGRGPSPGPHAIAADDDEPRIRHRLDLALASARGAAGVVCLANSRVTVERRAVDAILGALAERRLLYVDGQETPAATVSAAAQELHVPWVRADIAAGAAADAQALEARLWDLAALAGRTGTALGIVPETDHALQVLQRLLPRLEARGHRLVSVSRLEQ